MTEEDVFQAITKTLLKDRNVSIAKMFGAPGLRVGGKVFATLYKGKLVLKLSSDRVGELMKSGQGALFDPGHGRVSKEWVALGPRSRDKWATYVREAKEFVASSSPRATKLKDPFLVEKVASPFGS